MPDVADNSSRKIGLRFPLLAVGILAAAVLLIVLYSSGHLLQRDDNSDDAPGETVTRDVNVVLFLIDTLRADRLGVYGYSKPTSPNIDALAAESVLFEQAYAPAPWTLPSIASILTATFPCEHGVLVDGQRLDSNIDTLATRMEKAGYSTCSFYANIYAGPMAGLNRGHIVCRDVPASDGARVEQWLNMSPRMPFYLYIHNVEPHEPQVAPDRLVALFDESASKRKEEIYGASLRYRSLTRADFEAQQPLGTTDNTAMQRAVLADLRRLREPFSVLYDAAVRFADERVGEVVELLKRRGLWDNTLFILISDHGEEMSEHGGWLHDQSAYEELVWAPFIIHFPHSQYAGRRVKEVVTLVDLMPTIFDYLRRDDAAVDLGGESLMPLVRNERKSEQDEMAITAMRINRKKYYRPFKEARGDINVVVRQGEWKGILNAELGIMELYDLGDDSGEQSDLSGKYTERAQAMSEFAKAWLGECLTIQQEAGGSGLETLDDETLKRLRSLGYVN